MQLGLDGLRCRPNAHKKREQMKDINSDWIIESTKASVYDISGVKTWGTQYKCENCGFKTVAIEGHFSQYRFCPSCGKDMHRQQSVY